MNPTDLLHRLALRLLDTRPVERLSEWAFSDERQPPVGAPASAGATGWPAASRGTAPVAPAA